MIPPTFWPSLANAALKHWHLIAGAAVIAGLVVALLLTRGTLDRTKALYEGERAALAVERANHAVTRGSVATLKSAIEKQNADIAARAAALDAARKQAAADTAAADKRWKTTAEQVERLKAIAARPGTCPVPGELVAALEGL